MTYRAQRVTTPGRTTQRVLRVSFHTQPRRHHHHEPPHRPSPELGDMVRHTHSNPRMVQLMDLIETHSYPPAIHFWSDTAKLDRKAKEKAEARITPWLCTHVEYYPKGR